MKLRTSSVALLAGIAVLGGCTTVGADYAGPPPAQHGEKFARTAASADDKVLARWWSALADPVLDRLVERALGANPNLGVAVARVRQARASLRGEQANGMPKGKATALAAHARLPSSGSSDGEGSSSALPSSLNLYSLGFDASWEIDLFGGHRRATEAAAAAAESAEAKLADAQLSLVAEVAQAYVNLRATQAQIALSNAALARQQRAIDLVRQRAQGGTASELDMVRLQAQLEVTRSQAEPLLAQQDGYLDELAMLVGVAPGLLDGELAASAADASMVPLPPALVAVGDPAAMLRRRPDIRAAERTLAARQAQIGQAQAARFPSLTVLGLIGIGGSKPRDLTHLDDFSAIIAPQLSWNVLDFGRAKANVAQATGVREEAEAQYNATVLAALRDAEDALARFRQRRITVATTARAKASADRAAELMAARQRAGTASMIDVLDTERQQLAAEQQLAQAQAALTNDFIALHKALGLGWGSS